MGNFYDVLFMIYSPWTPSGGPLVTAIKTVLQNLYIDTIATDVAISNSITLGVSPQNESKDNDLSVT
jgi:hypothetical protein